MSTIETTSTLKVMLASAHHDVKGDLTFPKLASAKLDGIRAYIQGGVAYSRNGKAIRNATVQAFFSNGAFDGLDGELLSGVHDEMVFRRTTSVVMAADGGGDWVFHAFDRYDMPDATFGERLRAVRSACAFGGAVVVPVQQVVLKDHEEMDKFESECLEQGFEGIMVRNPDAKYKNGRATAKSQDLLKVKRFEDAEATIIGFEPLVRKDGKVEDLLGALIVKRPDGVQFSIGSGYDDAQRKWFWENLDTAMGKSVTYTFFAQGGYDLPRFPVFKGIREDI